MKRIFSIFLFAAFLISLSLSLAQEVPISAKEAHKYVGEVKTVCGKVVSTKYAYQSRGNPTFLNLDKAYPNQLFTIVIWGENRNKFEKAPEKFFKGKDVCVTGLIEEYKGKPQIIVKNPSQIKVNK